MNDIYKIKVNKNQNILNNNNSNSNLNSNIIPILNEEIPTSNFIRKIVLSKFKNRNRHNNDYFDNVQNHKDIYKEMPNKLSKSYKDLRFLQLNNNNIIYKNEYMHSNNSQPFRIIMNRNHKNKSDIMEEENGSKLLIYKSETQYPLTYRNDKTSLKGYSTMRNIYYNPYKNKKNIRFSSTSPKNHKAKKNEIINNKIIYDNSNNFGDNMIYNFKSELYDDNIREINYNPLDLFSNMTLNNYNQIYQPINEQINPNTNYYYANNKNIYFNDINYEKDIKDFVDYSEDYPYISRTVNRRDGYSKNEYIQLLKSNNIADFDCQKTYINNNDYNLNNDNDNDNKDKCLINIYKGKLIKIFVKFLKKFYLKYRANIFTELISKLKKLNKNDIIVFQNYKKNKINEDTNCRENNKILYINNNYYKYQKNGRKNQMKSLSSHKKFSSLSLFKKINKKRNINNQININYNKGNEETLKKSSSNIYIPAKTRIINNNYNNILGANSKISIFNEIKIDKNSNFIEIYTRQKDLNHQINNYYNTNFNNFYIKKNNSYNSNKNIKNKKPKNILWKIKRQNNIIGNTIEESNDNSKVKPLFYKKITAREKNDSKNDDNKNNMKIHIKKNENLKNKNKKSNNKFIRHTTNIKSKNIYNSTIFDNQKNNNIKNIDNNLNNSVNMSNDINNYCLDDKPMNIILLKNSNMENEEDSSVSNEEGKNILNMNNKINDNFYSFQQNSDSYEIKNLIQIKTEDKRLIINFNYLSLNEYKKNNKQINKNNLIISKNDSFDIICKKKYNIKNKHNKKIYYEKSPKKHIINSNEYIKKIKIKKSVLKLFNLINNKINENKTIFFENLKYNLYNLIFLKFNTFYSIISIFFKKKLKNYYKIFKININNKIMRKKKNFHVSFNEIPPLSNENNNNYNFIIESHRNVETDFINPKKIKNLKGKEKMKFLIKQIYKNNNSYDKKYKIKNNSFENDKKNNPINLCKSGDYKKNNLQKNNINNIYLKKIFRLNNNLNNNGKNED